MAKKYPKWYICWPDFDRLCLTGGCLYCLDKRVAKTKAEILHRVGELNEFAADDDFPWPITEDEVHSRLDKNTETRVE